MLSHSLLFKDEGNVFSARSHTTSHQCSSFFSCIGLRPWDTKFRKSPWCSFHIEHKWEKNEKIPFFHFGLVFIFYHFTSPVSLKTLNRLCSNNSAFQEDRGVSEGFSAELARDSTW
jgi:hypothetical protein